MTAPRHILLVTCHPDPRSLNGALRDHALAVLTGAGHTVLQSDLYAMRWKPVVDVDDFPAEEAGARLHPGSASRRATEGGTLTADVAAEQAKLLRADAVIFQFPLWWFSLPAMLKGWFDRVFSNGFAYGLTAPGARYSSRYGEGRLAGKRALLSVTMGGMPAHFSDRGVNGALEDLLFPVTHGTLFYPGMAVMPTFAVHGANRLPDDQFKAACAAYTARLEGLFTDAPIPFRAQNGGDYGDDLRLLEGVGAARGSLTLHRRDVD
jgi:NAD(P)H dehydrogenase (quinone)